MTRTRFPRRASPARPRRASGFTLVEILLATVLLATALALAFATLRAASGVAIRGEAQATRAERMRAVSSFLRARIGGARMQGYAVDEGSGLPIRFTGGPDRMTFVSDLPDYLGHGGPYIHELIVDGSRAPVRLLLGLHVLQPPGEAPLVAEPRPPEVLAEDLSAVRFRYRSLDDEGRLGQWVSDWPAPDQLPLQVEVAVRDAEGRDWPPMVVALPLAGSGAAGGARPGFRRP
jgi:general secretion pathway protein J